MDLEWLRAAGSTGGLVGLVLAVLLRSMQTDRTHYREQIEKAGKRADEAEARTRDVRADKEKLRKELDAELDALHKRFNAERDEHRADLDRLHEQLRQMSAELADARRLLARCCTQRDRDGPP